MLEAYRLRGLSVVLQSVSMDIWLRRRDSLLTCLHHTVGISDGLYESADYREARSKRNTHLPTDNTPSRRLCPFLRAVLEGRALRRISRYRRCMSRAAMDELKFRTHVWDHDPPDNPPPHQSHLSSLSNPTSSLPTSDDQAPYTSLFPYFYFPELSLHHSGKLPHRLS